MSRGKRNPTTEKTRRARKKALRSANPAERIRYLLTKARDRARTTGVEFNVRVGDIDPVAVCPILGTPITWDAAGSLMSNPSLDRADNARGYVPGNVYVVSMLGNSLKRSLTIDDARRMVAYMELAELLS